MEPQITTSLPVARLMAFVGNYGSGKTEVAVNYALQMAARGERVAIADLDIVNPYFRCREATEQMEARDIEVVVPRGANRHGDLPIVLPQIKGLLSRPDGVSILDVGGDDVGARALSHLAGDFPRPGQYRMLQVINRSRPFTDTVEGCLRMRGEIETSSRLFVTGLVSNTHLIMETTADTVREGYDFALEVAERSGLPLEMVVVPAWIADELDLTAFDVPVMVINREMLPPWVDDSQSLGWAGERERLRLMRG
ncbi:MAG: cobalamin biosynthesis protein CbiA [Myxococcota bacterium]|nr:cobalamin biosynthesis protein CbiA [Myxococcota bacterium]